MTVSQMRLCKTETRDMADRVHLSPNGRYSPVDWHMSNATFFTAFVVIVGVLAVLALVLRVAA
ncbi:hypothetical protein BH11MYX1_BH11MYX1_54580 [soil metagenome]